MRVDIQDYNRAAVASEEQMLLFNIGRLNGEQAPHFMMLSSVSQSRTFSAGASVQWSQMWNSLASPFAAVGNVKNADTITAGPFTGAVNENPTITFVPIQGQDFALRFETPLTDKFALFLEDREWYGTAAEREGLVLLFAQSLYLTHGDNSNCNRGKYARAAQWRTAAPPFTRASGLYVNRGPDQQDQDPGTHYYDDFSACVKEIVESYRDTELIDSGYPIPTGSSEGPKAVDLVPALTAGYEFPKDGDKGALRVPVRIPAWFDYNPKFVAPPKEPDSSAPVFWTRNTPPNSRRVTGYFLPQGYKWKTYKFNNNDSTSADVYALLPNDYDLDRDKNTGDLKQDAHLQYILTKSTKPATHKASGTRRGGSLSITETKGTISSEDVGTRIEGTGIPPGTTIVAVPTANTATMSLAADRDTSSAMVVGDLDQSSGDFSYADEVASAVWPVWKDYFYVELREGKVDDATAERLCQSRRDDSDKSDLVCGYFKIGNLLQIMQRLAKAACPSKDPTKIETTCQQSFFGIGSKEDIPKWANRWAPYTVPTKAGGEETKWVWVPAHDPHGSGNQPELAQRDQKEFSTLYKLYQMSLVDTTKLVAGAPPITISK
jgi:hypothetical protein